MSNRLGNTGPLARSPLPQEYPPPAQPTVPVRIVAGFLANLPGRSRLFFQRQFFVTYPRPAQAAGFAPFPRTIPMVRIQAPDHQSIVVREVTFSAFQHSGIGIEDLSEVPYGRSVGTLGFSALLDNRAMLDFQTNLPGSGVPIVVSVIQSGVVAPVAGQGQIKQGVGSANPVLPQESFASYVMPRSSMAFNAIVFRPPSFDLRMFMVTVSGWTVEAKELETILDRLSQ